MIALPSSQYPILLVLILPQEALLRLARNRDRLTDKMAKLSLSKYTMETLAPQNYRVEDTVGSSPDIGCTRSLDGQN